MRRRNMNVAERAVGKRGSTGEYTGRNSATSKASSGGDAQAFRTLYQENLGVIYRFIYSKVGNREEAEDLTSQVFLKAVRGLDSQRGEQSIQSWLYQVARTTIADYWRAFYKVRATSLEAILEQGWEAPAEERVGLTSAHLEGRVQAILELLPPHYREVLICRFLLNLSIKETAEQMRLSEANVKVLQFRALKKAAEVSERNGDS
ncbi:MAG TPA: sigma-70 family RNA polymerase sigma factor [Ktedonobacterales bacterium]